VPEDAVPDMAEARARHDGLKTEVGRARIAEAQSRRWRAYRERRQGTVASYWRLRCAVKQKAPLVRGAFGLKARL